MRIDKILIWGGSGHGKTTLARGISRKINIPHYDLDDVTFDRKTHKKVGEIIQSRRLKKILSERSWIIEGAYVGEWMHDVIKGSDLIILLNINLTIAQIRVLSRFIKGKSKGPLKELPKILGYARNYAMDHLIKQKELIKKFKKRDVIMLRNNKQINNFLGKIK